MAEKTRKGDFVEIEYTGTVKDDGTVFDTTDEAVAKREGFHNPSHRYGPQVVCLGQRQLVKGLDDFAVDKEVGKEYEVPVMPEEGFGKKDAKLMKLVPTKIFTKENITPIPGLPVNVDGLYGIIRTVTGGRVIVDFNHPLSGKEVVYAFRINKIITDDKEKLTAFLSLELSLKKEEIGIELKEGKAEIKIRRKMPEELARAIERKVLEIIPSVKKIEFAEGNDEGKQLPEQQKA